MFKGRFISYVKAHKMISKGCIYHIVRVRNVESEACTLYSVSTISQFPDDLPSIPLERKLDFGIDLLLDTTHFHTFISNSLSKIERPIEEFARQGVYKAKCVAMGCSHIVYKKEGQMVHFGCTWIIIFEKNHH